MTIGLPIVSKFDDKGVNQAASAVDKLRGTLKTFAGIAVAAFSVDAIVDFGRAAITAAEDAAVANNRLDAIAKSMGLFGDQTAGVTKRIKGFADQLALATGVEDEAIKAAQAQLLTFKNLAITADDAGGAFDRATKAVLDLSAAGLGSLDTSAVQLGKALQDPVKGIAALGRAGVTFTAEQKAFIQSLVNSNQMLEAQNYILDAIETQVGGTAEATATASQKMNVAFGEIQETIGEALLPAVQAFSEWLVANMPKIQEVINNVASGFQAFGEFWNQYIAAPFQAFAEEHGPAFQSAWENNIKPALAALKPAFELMGKILTDVVQFAVENLLTSLESFIQWIGDPANKNTIIFFGALIAGIGASFMAPFITIGLVIGVLAFLFKALLDFVNWANNTGEWARAIQSLVTPFGMLIYTINRVIELIRLLKGELTLVQYAQGLTGRTTSGRVPGQAKGGYTAAPGLSWVGEKGPELLSLPKGATVTPIPQHMRAENMMGANSGGPNVTYSINVNAGMGTNGTQVGQEIIKAISQFERGNGRVFARA